MKKSIFRAVGAVLLVVTTFSAQAAGIVVIDPWVRAAPSNAPALGVFMKLENHTGSDVSLVDARSSLNVDHIELHRTVMEGDVMKMKPQVAIPVAAHSAIVLKPGSWHIMLISPEQVPVTGESVELTLIFSDGTEQEVTAKVRKGKMGMNHKHEMKKMDQASEEQ